MVMWEKILGSSLMDFLTAGFALLLVLNLFDIIDPIDIIMYLAIPPVILWIVVVIVFAFIKSLF